ncbi:MAG: hypothetical protein J0I60_05380 [Nitrosospira sp.]|jgi:hypothetical protein|nr:hypothetical protein [Nitrosospira sp.]
MPQAMFNLVSSDLVTLRKQSAVMDTAAPANPASSSNFENTPLSIGSLNIQY